MWILILLRLTNFLEVTTLGISLIGTKSTYVRDADIKDTSFAQNICIKAAFIRDICVKCIYVRDANIVKYSEIDLQSF